MTSTEDPTTHQLRLLLTLAEELHFGRAAARHFLSQPALSQQIRAAEQRLGVRMFTRTSRRVEVTPLGKVLLPLIKNVVEATDRLRSAVRNTALAGTELRLGLSDCVAPLEPTRRLLAALTALAPDFDVRIRVVDLVEQVTAMENGEIDAALVYLPVPASMCTEPLVSVARVVCVSSTDPLAERDSVRLAELAHRPMVGLTPAIPKEARSFWAADPRPDGTPVRYTDHEVQRVESLLSAVSFEGAIAFLPAVAAELYPRPDVRYLPVDDLSPCTFGAVWLKSGNSSQRVAALRDACRRLGGRGQLKASAIRKLRPEQLLRPRRVPAEGVR